MNTIFINYSHFYFYLDMKYLSNEQVFHSLFSFSFSFFHWLVSIKCFITGQRLFTRLLLNAVGLRASLCAIFAISFEITFARFVVLPVEGH